MTDKRIILHPGFAKCATSSIQRIFALKDHQLGRSMDVITLGRELKANNGYPDVTKLMYARDEVINDFLSNVYADGRYFLSNEALAGDLKFVQLIGEVFTIERIVFTTRLPALQAISNYCFSGWTMNPCDILTSSKIVGAFSAEDRKLAKLEHFSTIDGSLKLVPVEGIKESFYSRFCETCFDVAPHMLGESLYAADKIANASISLAFADAMYHAMATREPSNLTPEQKRFVVKRAQFNYKQHGLSKKLPKGFRKSDWEKLQSAPSSYSVMLNRYGVKPGDIEAAMDGASKSCGDFIQQEICSDIEAAEHMELAMATVSESIGHVKPITRDTTEVLK